MKNYVFWFCQVVARLDRIPRYGRLYKYGNGPDGKLDLDNRTCEWRWQRRGRWGMNILMDMKLFWAFLDELDHRSQKKFPGQGSGKA